MAPGLAPRHRSGTQPALPALDPHEQEEPLTPGDTKTRELYPDSLLQTHTIFVSGNHIITEWSLQTILTEPLSSNVSRKVRVSLQGATIVRTENGKITSWSDYYDGLISRCTALASYFT